MEATTQKILNDLNTEITHESNDSKKRFRVSQPTFRHSLEFAINKGKEMTPEGYGFTVSAKVEFSDDNEVKGFDISADFKKGK